MISPCVPPHVGDHAVSIKAKSDATKSDSTSLHLKILTNKLLQYTSSVRMPTCTYTSNYISLGVRITKYKPLGGSAAAVFTFAMSYSLALY